MQVLGERLGQAVGQRLDHDGPVVVAVALEAPHQLVGADARGDREGADVIGDAGAGRRHEVGQRQVGSPPVERLLLPQHVEAGELRLGAVGVRAGVRAVGVRGANHDIVAVAHGGPEPVDAARGEALGVDDLAQQLGRLRVEVARRRPVARIVEDGREAALELPRGEEERPVDVGRQLVERNVDGAPPRERRRRYVRVPPLRAQSVGRGVGVGAQGAPAAGRELLPEHLLVGAVGLVERRLPFRAQERGDDVDHARGIRDVDGRRGVLGGDPDRRVAPAGGRPADEERQRHPAARHLLRHEDHLVERRRDEAAQADQIGALVRRRPEYLVAGHHHAEVDHLVVVAAEHHAHDVLADVVHVALHGGHHDRPARAPRRRFRLHVRLEDADRLLHGARALDHLGQEHLARPEEVADDLHAAHQRALDHVEGPRALLPRLLDVGLHELHDAVHEGVGQPLVDRPLAPAQVDGAPRRRAADARGEAHQPLGRVLPAVEDHVLDAPEQVRRNVLVDRELTGVDDPHVHAGARRPVEEGGVHGLAHHVVPAEGEREVADAAAHLRAGAGLLDGARGLDVVEGIAVVLGEPGGHGQDVRVEDDVVRLDARLLGQQRVGAPADLHLAGRGVGLAALVERHHDHRGAVAPDAARLVEEVGLALLEADGVDDRLPLHALQSRLDDRPLRAVDHDGHARDLGLGGQQAQERAHDRLGVEQRLVDVDVDHVGAAVHLLERHRGRRCVVARLDQPRELPRAGDVGPLPDHQEVAVRPDGQPLQAAGLGVALGRRRAGTRRDAGDGRVDRRDVLGRRPAATADQVDEAALGELPEQPRRLRGVLVVLPEGVRQPGVRVAAHPGVGEARQLAQVGPHLAGPEGAVDADREGARVGDRDPEGVDRLSRERAPAAIGDRHRDYQRDLGAPLVEDVEDGGDRRLRVQRVEDRLDQQQVRAAVEQPARLLGVGVADGVERDGAERRIVDVRRDGQRAVRGPDRTRDVARALRRARRPAVRRLAGEPRRGDVHLVGRRLEPVVGLRDGGRGERVGLDDVRAGGQVRVVNPHDRLGLRQHEDVVVPLQLVAVLGEARPPEVRLLEAERLHHGRHGTVEHQDALGERRVERGAHVRRRGARRRIRHRGLETE